MTHLSAVFLQSFVRDFKPLLTLKAILEAGYGT